MTLRKVTAGEWLAGLAGAALVVVMFLPWYGVLEGTFSSHTSTAAVYSHQAAWHSFSVILAFLLVTAALGLAVLALTANERSPALPTAAATWAVALGAITTILVAYRLIDPPGSGAHLRYGAWLGLACTAAVTLGGWLSLRHDVRP